jgi:hypothetical protein
MKTTTKKKKQIKVRDLKTQKDPKAGTGGATAPHGPARPGG